MSTRAKREYVAAIYERYRQAGRGEKGRILSEFCAVTGYHRLLNHPAPGAARPARQPPLRYAASTIEALRATWTRRRLSLIWCASRPCYRCGCRGRAGDCGCARARSSSC